MSRIQSPSINRLTLCIYPCAFPQLESFERIHTSVNLLQTSLLDRTNVERRCLFFEVHSPFGRRTLARQFHDPLSSFPPKNSPVNSDLSIKPSMPVLAIKKWCSTSPRATGSLVSRFSASFLSEFHVSVLRSDGLVGTAVSSREMAKLEKKKHDLEEDNQLLRAKLNILLEMLAEATAEHELRRSG